jgi:hypothetical protein
MASLENISETEKNLDYSHVESPSKTQPEDDLSHGFTPAEQRSIIHRIDRRLVFTVGAMYCVSLMDRTNMSAANIAGMSTELDLIGFRYVRTRSPESSGRKDEA